jgi:hypothetical protein
MGQLPLAQIYLGIAKGNAIIAPYMNAVNNDLQGLLDFKIKLNEQRVSTRK